MQAHLLLTRYARRVERGEMLRVEDVLEILGIPLLGVIPESTAVLKASNNGTPVILDDKRTPARPTRTRSRGFIGEQHRDEDPEPEQAGLFQRLLRGRRE